MPLSPRAARVAQKLAETVAHPPGPNQNLTLDPAAAVDPAQSNVTYFGSDVGPINQANADRAQTLSVLVSSAQVESGSNIQGLIGGSMSASGLWKMTAILRGENYGKSTSVVYQGVPDINKAVKPATEWVDALVDTIGNGGDGSNGEDGPSDASPRCRYVRITDAKNPRIGMLVEFPKKSARFVGFGGVSAGDNAADFTSTALSMRMQGVSVDVTKTVAYSNHAILYPPDAVTVAGGGLDLTHKDGGAQPYSKRVKDYLAYLTDPSNALGFTIIDPASQKKQCKLFTYNVNIWQCTCTAHGFADGDRVRLTGCNSKGFNGTYRINVMDPNTIAFNGGPPGSIPAPTTGKVQRVQTSDGVKLVVFASFVLTPIQQTNTFGLRVSKRNPAKIFTPVSFKKRARRLH